MTRSATLLVRFLGFTIAAALPLALAAANAVPASRAGTHEQAIGVNDMKPNACDSLLLSGRVEGSGVVAGGPDSELVLGSASQDSISGGDGDDCIVAGGGDDSIDGENGTDVCIGGPGADTFAACETVIQDS